MINFDRKMALETKPYLEEKGEDTTVEEILRWPRWKRVWEWWHALEKYEGKEIGMTLEECKKIYGDE